MALFGEKKNTDAVAHAGSVSVSVLKKPRFTEKSTLAMDNNVYTFLVEKGATKTQIKEAIKEMYNVTPKKVRVVGIPAKEKRRGQYTGSTSEQKKAYIYLKEGESIELA